MNNETVLQLSCPHCQELLSVATMLDEGMEKSAIKGILSTMMGGQYEGYSFSGHSECKCGATVMCALTVTVVEHRG